jgi:hypothetical protein
MRTVLVAAMSLAVAACQQSGSPLAPSASLALAEAGHAPSLRVAAVEGVQTLIATDKACLLITMDDTDSRNAVVGTIRGNGSVYDVIEGRDEVPGQNPPLYNRYVLKPSLLPVGHPEIRVEGGVMVNADVPAVVKNEYSQDTTLWWSILIGGGQNPTRAEMQARLRAEAYVNRNCTHYWQIVPGDSLTVAAAGQPGDLVSKFLPLP